MMALIAFAMMPALLDFAFSYACGYYAYKIFSETMYGNREPRAMNAVGVVVLSLLCLLWSFIGTADVLEVAQAIR